MSTELHRLAERIATELFTAGNDQRATRLQLKQGEPGGKVADERDLGGWCFVAVVRLIERNLADEDLSESGK